MKKKVDLTRFDFHVHRFMNSYHADQMDSSEVGQYLLLLCKAWAMGKDVCLPDDLKYLAWCARVPAVSERVLDCFPPVDTPDGPMRRNDALLEEWEHALGRTKPQFTAEESSLGGQSTSEAKAAAARENGKSGGRPKNPTQEPNPTQATNPITQGQSNPIQAVPNQSSPLQPDSASSENELAGEGGRDFLQRAAAIGMGVPTDKELEQLKALVARETHNGLEFLKHAVLTGFLNRPQTLARLKSPWFIFLKEADIHFANAKATLMASSEWRLQHVPGERERHDNNIVQQTHVISKLMNSGKQEVGESLEDFNNN